MVIIFKTYELDILIGMKYWDLKLFSETKTTTKPLRSKKKKKKKKKNVGAALTQIKIIL